MDTKSIFDNIHRAEKGAKLSIIAYLLLSAIKLFVGFFFSSTALFADGINNATDVFSSICILIGLKISRKPADDDHKYGHLKAELISSLISSFIMLYAGIQVVIIAIKKLWHKEFETVSHISLWVSLLATIIMIIVFIYNLNLSKKINSAALKAAAYDNLSDALVSFGSAFGIIMSMLGFLAFDNIIALIIGLIIIYTAIKIFTEATHILTDGIDHKKLDEIKAIVNTIDGVISIKDIKGRSHGLVLFIDLTITVDKNLNVTASHDITVKIEKAIEKHFYYAHTLIHLEPHQK